MTRAGLERPGRRSIGVLLLVVAVMSACGSDEGTSGTASAGCHSAKELADLIAPEITYDYDPTDSPAALAEKAGIVYSARDVSSVTQFDSTLRIEFDSTTRIFGGDRDTPDRLTFERGVPFDEVPLVDAFVGAEFLIFGSPIEIEGVWLACEGSAAAHGVIVEPNYGNWPAAPTFDKLISLLE